MAYRMGRSGYQVTEGARVSKPQDAPPGYGIQEAPRAKSRDQSDHQGSQGDPGRSKDRIANPEKAIQGTVRRDPKYIRDSYYYQR